MSDRQGKLLRNVKAFLLNAKDSYFLQVERYSHHITLEPEVQSRLSELELHHARQSV
jgi:hypothetical protein